MPDPFDPKTPPLRIRPYYWAHVARLARRYGVHPQVMIDTILSQAHYLPKAIGEDQLRRELMATGLTSGAIEGQDPEEMCRKYLDALSSELGSR